MYKKDYKKEIKWVEGEKPPKENWEKEFDKKFPQIFIGEVQKKEVFGSIKRAVLKIINKDVKSFIRNLLQEERQKWVKMGVERGIKKTINNFGKKWEA